MNSSECLSEQPDLLSEANPWMFIELMTDRDTRLGEPLEEIPLPDKRYAGVPFAKAA